MRGITDNYGPPADILVQRFAPQVIEYLNGECLLPEFPQRRMVLFHRRQHIIQVGVIIPVQLVLIVRLRRRPHGDVEHFAAPAFIANRKQQLFVVDDHPIAGLPALPDPARHLIIENAIHWDQAPVGRPAHILQGFWLARYFAREVGLSNSISLDSHEGTVDSALASGTYLDSGCDDNKILLHLAAILQCDDAP